MQEFDAKSEESRKLNAINVCIVTEFVFIIILILQCRLRQRRQLGGGSGRLAMPAVVVAVVVAWWQWRCGQLGGNTAADTASIGVAAAAQWR
jgi:hypothetical protein